MKRKNNREIIPITIIRNKTSPKIGPKCSQVNQVCKHANLNIKYRMTEKYINILKVPLQLNC